MILADAPLVLVVSDIRIYREGLADLLAHDPRIGPVRGASTSSEVYLSVSENPPSVICIDSGSASYHRLIRDLVESEHSVVLLGLQPDPASVCSWLDQGVSGYACKDASVDELVRTIESAAHHQVVCSREIALSVHRRACELHHVSAMGSVHLTRREREVGRLIRKGLSNKRIARRLNITLSTTKNHVHNLFDKLGVSSRTEAAIVLVQGVPQRQ